MGSDKKKTEGAQDHGQEIDEPVSMYILFARMFSIIARRIERGWGMRDVKSWSGPYRSLAKSGERILPEGRGRREMKTTFRITW